VRFLTEDAELKCTHGGELQLEPVQDLVHIDGRRVLIEPDPENREINGCPNTDLAEIRPCKKTEEVRKGYSVFIRVLGHQVCLDSVEGFTNGTPPRSVKYVVREPGQEYVDGDA
jgi:hypothetical protein